MSPVLRTRDAARRGTLALLAIGAALVAGATLPLQDQPGTSWAFLVPVHLFVAHSLLGLLVVADAVRLLAWARALDGAAVLWAGVGLAGCLVALGAGAASLADAGPDDVRPAMAVAWVLGLAVYGRLWSSSASALRDSGRLPAP